MPSNIQPIFSRVADIQGGAVIVAAAADYTGQNVNNEIVFSSDTSNGGYVQRLRFKALGTNVTTVARVYICNAGDHNVPQSNVPQTLTGTAASGGSILTGNLVARVASVDQFGAISAFSAESANVAVTGPTGNVQWNWNASSNSNTYILIVGKAPGSEERYIQVVGANTVNMTAVPNVGNTINLLGQGNTAQIFNNFFYGEISLPATTASATASTQDIDYPMNLALPPGYTIVVGLGTAVSAGWTCLAIGGKY